MKIFMFEVIAYTGRGASPQLRFQRIRDDSARWLRYSIAKFMTSIVLDMYPEGTSGENFHVRGYCIY